MIKEWTVQNFKSVYKETALSLSPLTIFAGANSSGKSTFIQSLLLTAQTLQSPVKTRHVILNGNIVRLGSFNDVLSNGVMDETIKIGFELVPIQSNFRLDAHASTYVRNVYFSNAIDNLNSIRAHFSFSARGRDDDELLQLQPKLVETGIKITSPEMIRRNDPQEIIIRRIHKTVDSRVSQLNLVKEKLTNLDITSLEFEIIKPTTNIISKRIRRFSELMKAGKAVGVDLQHFLPSQIQFIYDETEEFSRRVVDLLVSPDTYVYRGVISDEYNSINLNTNFVLEVKKVFSDFKREIENKEVADQFGMSTAAVRKTLKIINELLADFSIQVAHQSMLKITSTPKAILTQRFAAISDNLQKLARGNTQPSYKLTYYRPVDTISTAVDFIREYFNRFVKYLGPLRDEPKPVYPLSGTTDSKDVGYRGEHTAAVLDIHRNTSILYINPSQFNSEHVVLETSPSTLLPAVLDWLQYMGVASNVATADKGKLGHELKVKTSGATTLHDLTHVGVGVSQVLPILVLSLLAESGSTLIFEQPELHLHPRVQTRLADFFVSMTLLGKQCIVETHSEYLINRLRYQVAVSKDELFSKNILMYFVEKENNQSSFRPITINKYGVIEEWPKGFFDENEDISAAILKASMQKRRKGAKRLDDTNNH